jgi:hypothetical protein
MLNKNNQFALGLMLVIAILLTACTVIPVATDAPIPEAVPTEETIAPTIAAVDKPTPEPADVLESCPVPSESTSLYISRENGFCFLYPVVVEVSLNADYPQELWIFGKTLQNGSQEAPRTSLVVYANGQAGGLDSAGYADRYMSQLVEPVDSAREELLVDSIPAIVQHNLPSYFGEQSAFIVAGDYKYLISLMPEPEAVPGLAADLEALWGTVLSRIHFFAPEHQFTLVTPEDVCPVETEDTRVLIDQASGYCFAYLADFAPVPGFSGRVEGGPVLDTLSDFGDIRTSITLGTFGKAAGKTPREVIQPHLELIDASSLLDITIGGYPAVVYRNPQGPWASRVAYIVGIEDTVYTIVAQPLEPERWPAGIEGFNRLWNSAVNSLQFFTPFR